LDWRLSDSGQSNPCFCAPFFLFADPSNVAG
jgi:hypothetical protein